MNKQIICTAFAVVLAFSGYAQSGTNSPYSQYGIGVLSDQSQGFSRGMNGVGLAYRKGNAVNTLNPASYSSIDSLTMIFDVGLSGQITNFKEGNTKINAKNANFEYLVGSFRLLPKVGASFGVLPLSNIGYSYSSKTYLSDTYGTVSETYSGSGGLHQAFIGLGWEAVKNLSVGANVSYVWGTYERSVSTSSSSYVNTLSKDYTCNVNSYYIKLGAQWAKPLNATDVLTLGATVGLGHDLNSNPTCDIVNINTQAATSDTTRFVVDNGLKLPMSYGFGASWSRGDKLFVGADFTLEQWGKLDFPDYYKTANGDMTYALRSGLLKDRYKVNVGLDYVPSPSCQCLLGRVHYCFRAGYATPYYYINGKEGPKELSVSAGFGIPLQRVTWNSRGHMRPLLNISAQWAHTSAKDLITENTFRINVGLTFNERWFAKWKVE